MPSCRIGIVTVTYNSGEVLPDFFRSLWSQTHSDFILYAIDNASKDTTISDLHAQTDKRIRIVGNTTNVGVAEGNNIGVRMALQDGCGAVLLLNNDVVFENNLLELLLHGLETSGCPLVAPKTTYFSPSNRLWWAGGFFQKHLGYRTYHRGYQEIDSGQYDRADVVSYAPTCCLLVDRLVFEKIGLFDSQYFVYYDDTDFMYRAYRSGCQLYYFPDAVLQHKVSSLTGPESPFSVRFITRNRIYFWAKHFGRTRATAGLMALSFIYVARAITRKSSATTLKLQLRSLWEGLAMRVDDTAPLSSIEAL